MGLMDFAVDLPGDGLASSFASKHHGSVARREGRVKMDRHPPCARCVGDVGDKIVPTEGHSTRLARLVGRGPGSVVGHACAQSARLDPDGTFEEPAAGTDIDGTGDA